MTDKEKPWFVFDEWRKTVFVDGFTTIQLDFPTATVIGLGLYDSNEETVKSGHKSTPFRFRMSPTRARKLAAMLIATADDIEGVGHTRQ